MARETMADLRKRIADLENGQIALVDQRDDALRQATRLEARWEKAKVEQTQRENQLRDECLRLTVDNARMRGYIDRIEDQTPTLPDSRYGVDMERRARRNQYSGDSMLMNMRAGTDAEHHQWHHR